MPKKKRKSHGSAQTKRARPGSYPVRLANGVKREDVAHLMPISPDQFRGQGILLESPGRILMAKDLEGSDAKQLVERWPFRMSGEDGLLNGGYTCLALMAHEAGKSVAELCWALTELEDNGFLSWDGRANIYVMAVPKNQPSGEPAT